MLSSDVIYNWNESSRQKPVLPTPVEICDETLRDGIQSPSVVDPPLEVKLRMVELMDRLGIHIADIGLPAAGDRAYRDVLKIATHVRDQNLDLQINCAARTLASDIAPIADIQNKVGIPIVAYIFLGTSPIRQLAENWDLNQLLKTAEEAIHFAQKENVEVAFVTEDTARSKPQTLDRLFRHVIQLGIRRLVLCDTVGHATPDGVFNLITWTKGLIKHSRQDVKLDWHGHNDRGLGLVNALFAAEHGCERIHGTCLGIGERVGNTAIDQLIVNLKLLGYYPQDVSQLSDYVHLVSQSCKVHIPHNYPIFGDDAFRTATGVHAAAIIKAKKKGDIFLADAIYSGVPASWFGREQQIEIGPMCGASNVQYWLEKRGVEAHDSLIKTILARAKNSTRVFTENEVWDMVISIEKTAARKPTSA